MGEPRQGDLPPGGGPGDRRDAPPDVRRRAAEEHLETLPSGTTWIWSDGSAEAGVTQGGGGAYIQTSIGEVVEVKVAAGQLCSSTRAELIALRAALQRMRDGEGRSPVIACPDSRAALVMLSQGAAAQTLPGSGHLESAHRHQLSTGNNPAVDPLPLRVRRK